MSSEKRSNSTQDNLLLSEQVAKGDAVALQKLLTQHRPRLKQMVQLRISPQLGRRVDDSDIIQEAFLQAAINISDYKHDEQRPFYLWVRTIVKNKLIEAHRRHILATKRDATREFSLDAGNNLLVNSNSLAMRFVNGSGSNPLRKAMTAESRALIRQGVAKLDPVDREVIVLHHFEQMSMLEMGQELGLSKSGAAKRYLNALERLRTILEQVPGLIVEL